MNWKKLLIIAIAILGFGFVSAPRSEAGVHVGIGIGVPIGVGYGYGYGMDTATASRSIRPTATAAITTARAAIIGRGAFMCAGTLIGGMAGVFIAPPCIAGIARSIHGKNCEPAGFRPAGSFFICCSRLRVRSRRR